MEDMSVNFINTFIEKITSDSVSEMERASKVLALPETAPAECLYVWDEIKFTFTFGRYLAALSLSGIYIEVLLKNSLPVYINNVSAKKFVEPKNLFGYIELAFSEGLVTENERSILQKTRELVRNWHAHGMLGNVADSLFALNGSGLYKVEKGEVVEQSNEDEEKLIAHIRSATFQQRVKFAQEEYALRVIPWLGRFSASVFEKTKL